jgi:hypothetical protein
MEPKPPFSALPTGSYNRAIMLPRGVSICILVLAHGAAALIFDDHSGLARLHAYGLLVAALWVTLLGNRVDRVVYLATYIAGTEVLWRMVSAPIYWEFSKYALSLVLLLGLFRFHPQRRNLLMPLLYLVVLIPSVLLAFEQSVQLGGVRDALSFNLSGPMSLAISVMFFRQLRFTPVQANNVLWALVIPVCGIAARTLHAILSTDKITFSAEANFATSGGFGPNQVSAALGLGALAAIFLTAREKRPFLRMLSFVLFLWFTTHSFLTFSRGGIYNLAIAGALAALTFVRARGRRVAPLALAAGAAILVGWLILPHVENFTQDQLSVRFTSLETTRREALASDELRIWAANPVTGVGPGGVEIVGERTGGDLVAAHTEITRLLAEHGIGGAMAILLLIAMVRVGWRKATTPQERAWMVAFSAWALVEMTHSGMRLAAIGYCFGLAFMRLLEEAAVNGSRGP